ncbi:D-beta-hydroxybutyrate dehydrogenase [Stigmatella aurantiaca DW4/3-1]|uniref:D-beta-hydroxybutyrate dehydrogenase n=3 Tax=Stigmatella aurantiaca TaxID=41 RepID=Q08MV7_STIAD|nr:D-beta-hydroxybutyrate dehydrogenase [Stigmatella aurantiaca DW4/3-1]
MPPWCARSMTKWMRAAPGVEGGVQETVTGFPRSTVMGALGTERAWMPWPLNEKAGTSAPRASILRAAPSAKPGYGRVLPPLRSLFRWLARIMVSGLSTGRLKKSLRVLSLCTSGALPDRGRGGIPAWLAPPLPWEVRDMGEMSQKCAVVTGAANGIGLAVAQALSAQGARVLMADLDEERGQAAARELPNALFQRTDIASREDCRTLVARAEREWGRLDILVNNAGLQHVSPVEDFPEDRWEHLLRIMLVGPFLLTKYALPMMYARRWGRIINMSSLHGLVASPYKSAYVSAKHGLMGLTKTVALEAADKGVTVNAVCPSYVRTPLVEKQIADQARVHGLSETEVIEKVMLAPAAVKRLLEPSEVAAYVMFLCSEAAGGVTGGAQVIDCGWTAR